MQEHTDWRSFERPDTADDLSIDIHAVLRVLWRGKWIIAACSAVGILLTLVVALLMPPKYVAQAYLKVERGGPPMVNLQNALADRPLNEAVVSSEIRVLTSNRVLNRVIEDLDLWRDPRVLRPPSGRRPGIVATVRNGVNALLVRAGLKAAHPSQPPSDAEADALRRRITLQVLSGMLELRQVGTSYVIEIKARSRDPRLAADIANAVAETYLDLQQADKRAVSTRAVAWLNEQISELEAKVRRSAGAVEDFRIENGLPDESPVEQYSAQLQRLRSSLAETRSGRAALESTLAAAPAAGTAAADLAGGLALTGQREANLEASVRSTEGLLSEAIRLQGQLAQLERQADADRNLYERFLQELKVADALGSFPQADARIISDALPPLWTDNPGTRLFVALGGTLGAGLGIALVALGEVLRSTFRSRDEVEAITGRQVLASLPRLPRTNSQARLLARLCAEPRSQLADALRLLLHGLGRSPGGGGTVVMLASSAAREGKSALAVMLAQSARARGWSAIVLDCDIHRSRLVRSLGLRPTAGLADVLNGQASAADAIVTLPSGPSILPAIPSGSDGGADLFATERFGALVDELRATFDLVLIDTPPVQAVNEASLIAPVTDCVLYLVLWRKTNRALVRTGLQTLQRTGARVEGIVLNGVDLRAEAEFRMLPYTAYGY